MSPARVMDRPGQRRISIRQAISDSSWASSTIMCPNAQVRSRAARSAVVRHSARRAGRPAGRGRSGRRPSAPPGVLQVAGDDVQHPLGVGDLLLALAPGPLAGHPVIVAKQFGGLVEQGHVGWGPAAPGLPAEQVTLGRGQPGRRRRQPAGRRRTAHPAIAAGSAPATGARSRPVPSGPRAAQPGCPRCRPTPARCCLRPGPPRRGSRRPFCRSPAGPP